MHQPLDQQDVVAANIGFVAEENLRDVAIVMARLAALFRLDELAHHRYFQNPHQVGKEDESVFQNRERLDGLAFVVDRYLPSQFLDALLDLLAANDLA